MALFLFLVLSLCIPCYKVDADNNSQPDRQQSFTRLQEFKNIVATIDDEFDCVSIYKQPAFNHPLLKNHKIQFATLDTIQNTTYHGAKAIIALYNLSLQANQSSFSQIWLQSGPPTELNSIQVGFGVHPSLYGDSQLRLTGYWTADGYNKTGCFNILCPGFVQVDPIFVLGGVVGHTSTIGSETYGSTTTVKQDPLTGNWWLLVTGKDIQVGYWPKEIFTHLSQGSTLIRYGGEIFAPPNMISPPMGSGRLPKELFYNSAWIGGLEIVDSQYNQNDVKPEDMKSYCDTSSNCYDLLYHGYEGEPFKQAFLFGGPGGQCGI